VVGADKSSNIQNAINYLTTTQLPNGSWNDDPYSTALALRALANVKPNLSISSTDITFSNTTPTVGDTITITANIKNAGPTQADNVVVQFFDGNLSAGGVLIGETTIPSIPAYDNSETSISWTIPSASAHTIYAVIDPLNTIEELDEGDNIAYKNLTSATLPDLSIASADIGVSPSAPTPGEAVTITATVRNKGETAAWNVTMDFYDGDPQSGGANLYAATIPLINAGSSATFNLTTNFGAGDHDIYIVIDKTNSIEEGNETNNQAIKIIQVGGGVDLSITTNDISFSPANPVEGNTVTVTATIHNESETGVTNVLVRFYLGDPDSGGSQIGNDINISSISARGTANISTTWDSTGHAGSNDIYVRVDPLNTISEITELNNKAFKTIKIAAKAGPDLALSQADINFIPLTPNTGDTVTITANIRNIGTSDASDVLVEFSLGDPNIGGTLIIGSLTIPFITKGSSTLAQITWNTTGFSGTYEVYANADPFNGIAELSETNNTSHIPITITAPQWPDLTISLIDTTNFITDNQSLQVSGSVKVTLENKGNQSTNLLFEITIFEDRDKKQGT